MISSDVLHPAAATRVRAEIRRVMQENLRAPTNLNLVEWADTYRYLPDNSAESGRWRTDRVEVARQPMMSISDKRVQEVTIMSCIQLMKTEAMINAALYYMHQEPCPIMYVAPKVGIAEAWSKERLVKSVLATPVVQDIFSKNRRGEGNTILQKQFPGGQISIVSARNPADLAMRAVMVMLFDEIDKYEADVSTSGGASEGDPIAVAWGRATTYGKRAKKICACSPTVAGKSRIEQEYLASNQSEYFQKCPHCSHVALLDWHKNVHMVEIREGFKTHKGAKIVCLECGCAWNEKDRFHSIKHGEWVAKVPEVDHHHGYRVSAFASPFTPVETLAKEFIAAEKNPLSMQAFVNTRMAQTHQETGEAPDWKRLYERRDIYKPQTIPSGGLMVVCGIDVQKDYLIYEVVAYGRRKRSWSVDIGVIEGKISSDKTQDELKKFLEYTYPNEHGKPMAMEMVLIDSSNDTQEVYSVCAAVGSERFRPIKGQGNLSTSVGTPKPVQINVDGVRRDGGIKMYPLGVNVLKEQLYKWLLSERPTDEALALGDQWPTGYCHFPEWSEDYFKQLTAEILIERKDAQGYPKMVWEKVRNDNHYLDCRNYARAGASMLGLDRMTEEDWLDREAIYGDATDESGVDATPSKRAEPTHEAGKPRKRPQSWFKRNR